MKKRNTLWGELKKEMQTNRRVFIVWAVLRLFVLQALIMSLYLRLYENAFICVLVLVLFLLPNFLQKRFRIELPSGLQIIILLFIFASEILGELACYYVQYPHWDTMLHTTWGFLCAAFGFSLVDLLNSSNKTHCILLPFIWR